MCCILYTVISHDLKPALTETGGSNQNGPSIRLGGFNELLLHGTDLTPNAHEAGVLLPIGASHEASVIWAQGCGEHPGTPWPVHVPNLQWVSAAINSLALEEQPVCLLDVGAGHDAHLLTGVGDLWDGWNRPIVWLLACLFNAPVVAIAHSINAGEALLICAPKLAIASLDGQVLVLGNGCTSIQSDMPGVILVDPNYCDIDMHTYSKVQ